MNIAIRCTENQQQELLQKGFNNDVNIEWLQPGALLKNIKANAFFDFVFNDSDYAANEFIDDTIVFVHAVNCLCAETNKSNYVRLNAWNGFLNRNIIELSCNDLSTQKKTEQIFNELGWNYVWVKDEYGFIAARIIAMIINEAYFALEENVSTKEQIDIAMKLGTNYPYGPFEWSEKIGLKNIAQLLLHLQEKDERYSISSLLIKEST